MPCLGLLEGQAFWGSVSVSQAVGFLLDADRYFLRCFVSCCHKQES